MVSAWVTSGQMPSMLIDAVQADPTMDEWAGFTAAMAFARAGVAVLPCAPGGKAPVVAGPFKRGARSATTDSEALRDIWLSMPSANVAVAPDDRWVLIDVDPRNGGTLEGVERLGLDVSAYRERSGSGGHHIPLRMPPGIRATRSAIHAPGVELIAKGRFAVSPASRLADGGVYRPEPGRDIWTWGAIPAGWRHLATLTESGPRTAALAITADDERDADDAVRRLLQSAYADDVRAVLFDGQGRFLSRSEADFALALAASHHLRDHLRREQVVVAVLHRHSRKARDHADPGDYITRTTHAAIAGRDLRDADRLAAIRRRLLSGLPGHAVQGPDDTNVLDVTLDGIGAAGVVRAWLRGQGEDDEWARADGWHRLPVSDVAAVVGLARESVSRSVAALARAGEIEREILTYRHDGAVRRDCLIRSRDPPP